MQNLSVVDVSCLTLLEQLHLEERLLRSCDSNYCLLRFGGLEPTIVMGISGKEELINKTVYKAAPIPIIRRYSGGGTVVLDADSILISLICDADREEIAPYPEAIMRWSESLYRPLFGEHFRLRENDYVFGDRKFGGNAQYISKKRFVHHTSFLWNYQPRLMDYLTLPAKRPAYRESRMHADFLCTLAPIFVSMEAFKEQFLAELGRRYTLTTASTQTSLQARLASSELALVSI